jgi:hypothetical protein
MFIVDDIRNVHLHKRDLQTTHANEALCNRIACAGCTGWRLVDCGSCAAQHNSKVLLTIHTNWENTFPIFAPSAGTTLFLRALNTSLLSGYIYECVAWSALQCTVSSTHAHLKFFTSSIFANVAEIASFERKSSIGTLYFCSVLW